MIEKQDIKTENMDWRSRILALAENAPPALKAERIEPEPEPEKTQPKSNGKALMWPAEIAAQPTELSRCGLFGLRPKQGQRTVVNDQLLESRGDLRVLFSGELLSVKDETLWLAILRMGRGKPVGERIFFHMTDLLNDLGIKDSGGKTGSREQIKARLKRLSKAHFEITLKRADRTMTLTTGLLKFAADEASKMISVRLDPDGARLFENRAYQNWEIRLALKSDVAIRLYDYVVGHQAGKPHAQKIENLRAWFGYSGRRDKFRVACVVGLSELEAAGVVTQAHADKTTLRWVRTA